MKMLRLQWHGFDLKATTARLKFVGSIASLRVASVTTPRVPSDPVNKELRLYLAEIFLSLCRVLMTVPSARTTVRLTTWSFLAPYLMALVPLQFVAIMPPM